MNRIYSALIFVIIIFLIMRFMSIKPFGENKELFQSNLVESSLHFDRINNEDEFKLTKLHDDPQIILIDNFLTNEECEHIIKIGDPLVKQSEVCGRNGSRPDKSRTSWTAHIGKKFINRDSKDPILMKVLEKAAKFGKKDIKNIEPIQLVRYKPGQYFKSHYDYLDTRNSMYRENVSRNGQREITFFVYLNNHSEI